MVHLAQGSPNVPIHHKGTKSLVTSSSRNPKARIVPIYAPSWSCTLPRIGWSCRPQTGPCLPYPVCGFHGQDRKPL